MILELQLRQTLELNTYRGIVIHCSALLDIIPNQQVHNSSYSLV
jgi:hypothetical protein